MSTLLANFLFVTGDDVAEATPLVQRRRLPSGPRLGGREAAEAPRIMFFIGHSAGRLDVFARPSSRSTVDRGQVMRASLQAADPGFAGAVVTRRVRGRK